MAFDHVPNTSLPKSPAYLSPGFSELPQFFPLFGAMRAETGADGTACTTTLSFRTGPFPGPPMFSRHFRGSGESIASICVS